MAHTETINFRPYWIAWAVLLALTLVMLVLDGASIARTPFLLLMLVAMSVKASLIAGTFMHLRFERTGIVLTVVVGLFVLALVLYVLIVPDAARIHEMLNPAAR